MAKVKFRLHELMGERKIRSISKLANETGLSRPTLTRIYNNETSRIEFETIEKLVDFFECGVNDLFVIDELASNEEDEEKTVSCA